jgi:hypothetical protein
MAASGPICLCLRSTPGNTSPASSSSPSLNSFGFHHPSTHLAIDLAPIAVIADLCSSILCNDFVDSLYVSPSQLCSCVVAESARDRGGSSFGGACLAPPSHALDIHPTCSPDLLSIAMPSFLTLSWVWRVVTWCFDRPRAPGREAGMIKSRLFCFVKTPRPIPEAAFHSWSERVIDACELR